MPKSFYEYVNLLEGISVHIKDMEYPSNVDDMGSLEQTLGLAIKKAFPTVASYNPEIVQQDGFNPGQTEGIINFYHVKGLTPEQIKKIEQAIMYYLKEFNVKAGKTFVNQSNLWDIPVTRIPVKINNRKGERVPEVNMTQQMAFVIMHDILNYPSHINFNMTTLDARDLLVKLSMAHDYSVDKHIEEPSQDKNVFSGGVSKERIQRQLDALARIAQYALDQGYTELVFS